MFLGRGALGGVGRPQFSLPVGVVALLLVLALPLLLVELALEGLVVEVVVYFLVLWHVLGERVTALADVEVPVGELAVQPQLASPAYLCRLGWYLRSGDRWKSCISG